MFGRRRSWRQALWEDINGFDRDYGLIFAALDVHIAISVTNAYRKLFIRTGWKAKESEMRDERRKTTVTSWMRQTCQKTDKQKGCKTDIQVKSLSAVGAAGESEGVIGRYSVQIQT